MKEQVKLGQRLTGDEQRDAVHVAVAPVWAGDDLLPGHHVGLNELGEAVCVAPFVGIVDPFLLQAVRKGERFYLCLYPGTVTSLRHDWTHPAFLEPGLPTREQATAGEPGPASGNRLSDLEYAEEWLRRYAVEMNCYMSDQEKAYQQLLEGLRKGELFAEGSDLHGLYDLQNAEELRQHAEVVLGRKIDFGTFTFSCYC